MQIDTHEWPQQTWWQALFDPNVTLLKALPHEFHTGTGPLEEFLAWLEEKPYVNTSKKKVKMARRSDYATILAVIALLERDVSRSMGTEETESDALFWCSCLSHRHLDRLHEAIRRMVVGMGYIL
jgi:hypothetical protein